MAIILSDRQVKNIKFILKSVYKFPCQKRNFALEIGAILENGKKVKK